MIAPSGPSLLRWIVFCTATCLCASGGAVAQEATSAAAMDAQVNLLKSEVLQINRDAELQEQALLYPDYSRVSVYVGVRVRGFILDTVTVRIDDGAPVTYTYSESESRALLQNGLHRLLRDNVTLGAHRLRAEFSGHFFDAKADEPKLNDAIETVFTKTLAPVDLVLPLARAPRKRVALPEVARLNPSTPREAYDPTPILKSRDSAAVDYLAGSEADPRLQLARFLKNDSRYFSALIELLKIAADSDDPTDLPAEYQWLLAECYLLFGMHDQAQTVYRQIAVSTTEHETLNRARIKLAELQYDRGDFTNASAALLGMREKLPEELVPEWQDLLSRVLMAEGRYNEAVEVLTELDNAKQQTPFMRYNLGVAMINDGRVAQGRNVLDKVGTMTVKTVDQLALRDKANLTLGYHFLRAEQGATAKPLFARVRQEGPFSNRALLGLGWAELAPKGEKQTKAQLGDDSDSAPFDSFSSLGVLIRPGYFDPDLLKRLGLRPFRLGRISEDEEEALLHALVTWTELIKRDPMDAAVQEGLLAIPFALDRLGAYEQGLSYYQRAIETLEESRKRIDAGIESIRRLTMVETIVRRDVDAESGWDWRLKDLPDLPETYWLTHLIAENRFQEALKNYRDVRLMGRNLDSLLARAQSANRDRQLPPVSPEALVAEAARGWKPPTDNPPLTLRTAQFLGAGIASAAARPPSYVPPPIQLRVAAAPARFPGPLERMQALHPRTQSLRPLLAQTGADQARLLQNIAIGELESQKKQIEKYLLEARFAVARIYDRQLREAAPSTGETP